MVSSGVSFSGRTIVTVRPETITLRKDELT